MAGFRVLDYLAWGHALYCDDLSTRITYRGRGHAGLLLDWMIEEAGRLGCGEFHLDSGVGPDRTGDDEGRRGWRVGRQPFHFVEVELLELRVRLARHWDWASGANSGTKLIAQLR